MAIVDPFTRARARNRGLGPQLAPRNVAGAPLQVDPGTPAGMVPQLGGGLGAPITQKPLPVGVATPAAPLQVDPGEVQPGQGVANPFLAGAGGLSNPGAALQVDPGNPGVDRSAVDMPAATSMWSPTGSNPGGAPASMAGTASSLLRRRMRMGGLGGGSAAFGGGALDGGDSRMNVLQPMAPTFDPVTGDRLGDPTAPIDMGSPTFQDPNAGGSQLKPGWTKPGAGDPRSMEPGTPIETLIQNGSGLLQQPKAPVASPVSTLPGANTTGTGTAPPRDPNPTPLAKGGRVQRYSNGGAVRRMGLGKLVGAAKKHGSPVKGYASGGAVKDPYGKWGNLRALVNNGGIAARPDLSHLPPEIQAQLQQYTTVDEGGGQKTLYDWNRDNPWGGYQGQDGQHYVQIGDPSNWRAGDQDGGVKDRAKVIYDPEKGGYVTTADNLHDSGIGGPDLRMIAAVLGAGALGTVAGLGAEAGNLGAGTMTGLAGDESAGLAMGGAGSGSGGASAGLGLAGDESAGLTMGGTGSGAGSSAGAGIGADESAGLTFNPGQGASIGADESAGLTMNPSGSHGIGADESAGLNMDTPSYGVDTTQINPAELEKVPEINQAAARNGMSVTDWLKNPTNLQSAIRFAAGLAGAASSGHGAHVAPVTTGGTVTPGAPGAGAPAAGGAPSGIDLSKIDVEGDPLQYLRNVNVSGGGAANGMIQQIMNEATARGSASDQEAAAGRAGADTAQKFANARQALRARLAAQGINPDDPRGPAGELDRLSHLDEAKAAVGGQNAARIAEREKGFGERTAAAGLGLQSDAQTLQSSVANANLGAQRAQLAGSLATSKMNLKGNLGNADAQRQWQSGESAATRDWTTGENARNRDLRAQEINAGITAGNRAADRQQARDVGTGVGSAIDLATKVPWGSVASAFGFKRGGRVACRGLNMSEGGDVAGPGTETSDSIPARLSDGEFVVNAEGVALLDKIAPNLLEKANARGLKVRSVRQRGLGA